jgi:phosphoribosyl 1,2-cyclic phosphodiesterase
MPLLDPRNQVRVHAGHLAEDDRIETIMLGLLDDPMNPVNRTTLAAQVAFLDFTIGAVLEPFADIRIRTAPLVHPNRAVGYRIEFRGHSICYVTDTEHRKEALDANILGLIAGADLMIYDSTYTDEEYPRYTGWGHSTWQEGARLCAAAAVKTFVVFHHDPGHDDQFMDRVQSAVEAQRPGSIVAREGMVLRP